MKNVLTNRGFLRYSKVLGTFILLLSCISSWSQSIELNQFSVTNRQKCGEEPIDNLQIGFTFTLPTLDPGNVDTAFYTLEDNGVLVQSSEQYFIAGDTAAFGLFIISNHVFGSHVYKITATTNIDGQDYTADKSFDLNFGPQFCATVSGKVVIDMDPNCLVSVGDMGMSAIRVNYGLDYVNTASDGSYSFQYPKNESYYIYTEESQYYLSRYFQSNCADGPIHQGTMPNGDLTIDVVYNIDSIPPQYQGDLSIYRYPRTAVDQCSTGSLNDTASLFMSVSPVIGDHPGVLEFSIDGVVQLTKPVTLVDGRFWETIPYVLTALGDHSISAKATVFIDGDTIIRTASDWASYGPQTCKIRYGKVLLDMNGNCQSDGGDQGLENVEVVYDRYFKVLTNSNGEYSFLYPDNPYNYFGRYETPSYVADGTGKYYRTLCPEGNSWNVSTDTTTNVHDFLYNKNSEHSFVKLNYFNAFSTANPCEIPARFDYYINFSPDLTGFNLQLTFGDGTDTSVFISATDSLHFIHDYYSGGTFNVQGIAQFEDTTIVFQLKDPVYVGQDCGNVSGLVYQDADASCSFSAPEVVSVFEPVSCKVGAITYYTYTDSSGHYFFQVPAGAPYTVKLLGADNGGKMTNGLTSCPPKLDRTDPELGLDFGLGCNTQAKDLKVQANSWRFRPGFEGVVNMMAYNYACEKSNATLKLELTDDETFSSATPPPTRINGKVLEWDLVDLDVYAPQSVTAYVMLSQTSVIGDTVCHNISIDPIAGDEHPEDNAVVSCSEIRGSWDPNDKQVFVGNAGQAGDNIKITDRLTYLLRFQNTGTDTAFNIYLLDTLSADLDLNTFEVGAYSHPVKIYINNDRVVRFEFNDILLPDDKTDEPKSHGFVSFGIRPRTGVQPGDVIRNTGYIYFDFNEPVITNTTVSTVINSTGIGELEKTATFSCYPNPASQFINLKLADGATSGTYRLIDILGKEVMAGNLKADNELSIAQLANGVYTIKVEAAGKLSSLKIVVSH